MAGALKQAKSPNAFALADIISWRRPPLWPSRNTATEKAAQSCWPVRPSTAETTAPRAVRSLWAPPICEPEKDPRGSVFTKRPPLSAS